MKNKITRMKTKPEITDDEIRSYMNFNRLVQQAKHAEKSGWAIRKMGMTLLGMMVVAASWYLIFGNLSSDRSAATVEVQQEQQSAFNRSDTVNATRAHPPKKESSSRLVEPLSKNGETTAPKSRNPTYDAKAAGDEIKVVPQAQVDSVAGSIQPALAPVYKQAEPVDGYSSLYEYFARELRYPQEVIADSIEGVVLVAFTINTQGRPEKVMIEQSLGSAFDQEGVRVITSMPDWKPASYNDKPVPSRISVPLTFEIRRIKAND